MKQDIEYIEIGKDTEVSTLDLGNGISAWITMTAVNTVLIPGAIQASSAGYFKVSISKTDMYDSCKNGYTTGYYWTRNAVSSVEVEL